VGVIFRRIAGSEYLGAVGEIQGRVLR